MRNDRSGLARLRRLLVIVLPRIVLPLIALAITMPACGPGSALSADDIKKHGVVLLRTPPEKVYKAVLEALKALGYEVAVDSPDKGLVVTKKKGIPDMSASNGANTTFYRQYTIEIQNAGGGSRVTATPAIFEDERDVSKKKVWDLDGPLGERELWKQLFAKIEQLL